MTKKFRLRDFAMAYKVDPTKGGGVIGDAFLFRQGGFKMEDSTFKMNEQLKAQIDEQMKKTLVPPKPQEPLLKEQMDKLRGGPEKQNVNEGGPLSNTKFDLNI